jgi:hypothetical protein
MYLVDNQQALSFLVEQSTYIEAEVYKIQYPEIIYSQLIPIDTSANEWAKSVTYFSMDKVGQADWFDGTATDMRLANVNRAKFEQGIEMAGIGYRYNLEELGQAMLVPNTNLSAERAEAARFAYEQFMDRLAYKGDAGKGFPGLINSTTVTRVDAAASGTGSGAPAQRLWVNKTADQQIADVNGALTGVYESSNTVEMADTVLLPVDAINQLSISRIPNTAVTALEYLAKNNLYTHTTGIPLTIRGVLGLGTAGSSGVGRMVAYRRDPRVLKLHVPMVHRFLPVWQTGPITFDIPGIFRVGSVEIRRPGAMRYVDGITDGTTN